MLTSSFICDFCGKKYEAVIQTKGAFKSIIYKDESGLDYEIENASEPCHECENIAQHARDEALAKRKQGRNI